MKSHRVRKVTDLIIFAVVILLTILAAFQIGKLEIDSSIDVFIPEKNKAREINDEIRREFGGTDSILLGVETRFSSILDDKNLVQIDEITKKLEDYPKVEKVISLTNIEYIESSAEGMEVFSILEGFTKQNLDDFRYRLNDWNEMYTGTVISSDGTLAAIIIQPEKESSEQDRASIYQYMEDLASEYGSEDLSFPMAGKPVINKEISRSLFRDIIFLIPIVAFLIILVLFFSFRKPEGVVFPMLSLAVSCIWVMGLMGVLRITFSMASILIPVLLLVVGSAYGIHIMAHFYKALSEENELVDFNRLCELIKSETGKIRKSIILAGVTTAAGFLSQLSSPLVPFRVFGIMSAAGIFFSLLLTFFLIPALIRLRYPKGLDPWKFQKSLEVNGKPASSKPFVLMEKIVIKGKWAVVLISILLLGSTILLIPKITIGTNLIDFFTSDSKMVKDTKTFNEKLNGTGSISLAIRAPDRGGVLTPKFLKDLENFEQWLPKQVSQVTKVQSIVPGIKRMNMIMNSDRIPYEKISNEEVALDFFADGGLWGNDAAVSDSGMIDEEIASMLKDSLNTGNSVASADDIVGAAFDEIPSDPAKYGFSSVKEIENMLSQYMILYSGSLSMMLNDSLEPDRILITIQIDKEASRDIMAVNREIGDYWDYNLPEDWSYEIAGNSTFNVVLSDLVAKSQLISLCIALLIVWLILIILFRSVKTGTIGMIPVFFALSGIFTFMVLFGFNLDIVTSLLAALAVGIGVDYAIHFMTSYRRELLAGSLNPLASVYQTTGRAILYNAFSVALGFLGLLFSRFIPIRQMGILFAVAMVFASISALIILPMLLIRMKTPFKNINEKLNTKEIEKCEESYSTV